MKRSHTYSTDQVDDQEYYVGNSVSGYMYKGEEAVVRAVRTLLDRGESEIIIQRADE